MSNYLFSIFPDEHFVDLTLYQYGWERCEPLKSFGPYARNHYLFHYVISGTGTLIARDQNGTDQEYRVRSGDGFMLFPKQASSYFADKAHPWEYTWVEFDGMKANEIVGLAGLTADSPIYHPGMRDLGLEMRDIMLNIARSENPSAFYLVGQLHLFADYLTRSSSNRHLPPQSSRIQDFYVKEAINFVEQNFQNDISVEDMAAFCNLNRNYFGKIFRNAVGKTPQEFLISYRMTKASELLKLTDMTIGNISNAVGYPSQLHFSRAFKNVYGIPPKEWRSRHKMTAEK